MAQLEAALGCDLRTIYCEFEDPKKYREAVNRFSANPQFRNPQSEIFAATSRIFKPGEEWILKQVRSCEADGYLIRNYDHLNFFADCRRVGDYSLNVANGLAADYFKNQFGLERLTASYDLNIAQLEALLQSAPPAWFEITIHQHIPMFHMEHCVFCAFLTSGTDYTNCGRPATGTPCICATGWAWNIPSRPTPAAATPFSTGGRRRGRNMWRVSWRWGRGIFGSSLSTRAQKKRGGSLGNTAACCGAK